jgi:MFS family permease
MSSEKRYVALLACAQALLLTHGVLLIAVNGLSGLALAPDRRLATLPVTSYVLGAAIATVPASYFMKRHGRRRGFMVGAAFGMLGCAGAAPDEAARASPPLAVTSVGTRRSRVCSIRSLG